MTDSSPSEFVAAYELSRYSPEDVIRLIEAAKRLYEVWGDQPPFPWVEVSNLFSALGAVTTTGGES